MTVWIFTHGDGDGLCAGALALAANPEATVYFTHPYGLSDDLENASEGDDIIICDIALSEHKLPAMIEKLSTLDRSGNVIYIDHHPLPESLLKENIPGKVIHSLNSSASELAYSFFREKLGKFMSRVAIFGAIADYLDETPLIGQLLCNWDKRTVYFETGVLVQGIEGRKRDYEFKRDILFHLAANNPPSTHTELLEEAIKNTKREEEMIQTLKEHVRVEGEVAYVLDAQFSLGKTAIYARALTNATVGVASERRKGMVDMSLRSCRKGIDLNRILRQITKKFGGDGGGHPTAAGARIPEEHFHDFIKELNITLTKDKPSENG